MYRCEARNANPAPQIQWVVNNDVINVDSNVLSSPTSSSDSFSRSGGSNEALFGDNNLQRSSIRNSKHSSTLSSSVQVTTQIHPPPSLSMSLTYGSGAGIQVSISYRIYTGCSMNKYLAKYNKILCLLLKIMYFII